MKITIDHLKHFQSVVRVKNLNKAALSINISPSAISRSIKIIEQDLGYEIFDRVGRNMIINQQGLRFYEKSVSVMESYQSLFSNKDINQIRGTFKIGASHWLAAKFLPQKIHHISSQYPDIKFEIFSLDSNVALSKVISGDLDFSICFSPKKHAEISSKQLLTGQIKVCTSSKHKLTKLPYPKSFNELSNYEAIIHKPNELINSCDEDPIFSKYKIKPEFKYYWDSDFIAIELLKNNPYWTLMPDIIIENELSLKAIDSPKQWNSSYCINAIWNKNRLSNDTTEILKYF